MRRSVTVWFDGMGKNACIEREKRKPGINPTQHYLASEASMKRLTYFAIEHKNPGSVIPSTDGWLWLYP